MKFSVLLPTCNRLELLQRAVQTVLMQDFDDWELIVSDNFSTEDIKGYVDSLDDERIKYYRTDEFIPVTENWNNALDKSSGDYIIMLGDDDCILSGYFSLLNNLIELNEQPELIYTGALLYAYPNVIPGCDSGFLRSYENRAIYKGRKEAFILPKADAKQFALDALDFRVEFDFNMQFSLVSRKLINKLKAYGSFYQSPYPDYYASNALLLLAEDVLIVPRPLVVVGISPKSFGFYYFNDAEDEGNNKLNNSPNEEMVNRLKQYILPGNVMNTSWLISMDILANNLSDKFDLKPTYQRYRLLQIVSAFAAMLTYKKDAEKI